ncbi:hypothetical protein ASG11_01505 [Sphingomonas sp. Leaf357]|uniref:hypothetical protein n=1 Tax=Sphingomonas sp. Leaf357 TaxID=1736350 RepID=UPI0006F7A016|nr:hypothetical protein [Sphingomonas sp. Leaf357]KQS03103.1 hypothetical protein ASG11_01505 [Sphingomonas sp. Leaf357]
MQDGEGGAELSVGFTIDADGAFGQIQTLDDVIGTAAANAVREWQRVQAVMGGGLKLASSMAEMTAYGNASTRAALDTAKAQAAAERAGDGMVRQLQRQIDTFGKTSSEIRNMNAELKATAADSSGLTVLAADIRKLNGELNRLEAGGGRAEGSVRKTGGAMAALAPQAQDAFTQVSMGTNVLSVLAIQGGQAAGQMVYLEGAAGSFGRFMMGPWGIALTGATLVAAALTKGMFDGADAAKTKEKAAKDLADAVDKLASSTAAATTTEWESQRATLASAAAYRQQALDARALTVEKIGLARADLAAALAASAKPDPSRGQDGGIDFDLVQAGQIQNQIKTLDASLAVQQKQLERTTVSFREAQAVYIGANIAGRLDKETGLTREYQKQLSGLNVEFRRTGDVDAYAAARLKLEKTYAGERDALKESEKAQRSAAGAHHGLTDAQREAASEAKKAQGVYDASVKTATEFADAQRKTADTLGLSAEQLRAYADAAAIAKAPTDALKQAIRDAAAAREAAYSAKAATDFQANVMKPLQDELALYGLVGPARAAAALELEKETFITKNGADAWREYHAAKANLIGKDAAAAAEASQIAQMRDEMDKLVDAAHRAGDALANAFGRVGGAIGGALGVLAEYSKAQKAIGADTKLSAEQKRVAMTKLQIEATGDLIGQTKNLFKEHSTAYKAMAAAEQVYRVAQFAMSVQAMAQNVAETLGFVANSTAKQVAAGTEGIANQSKLTFPYNLVAMAATGAALVAAGISVFGGSGGGAASAPVSNKGTGTVLGDGSAQSESIKNAIDALGKVDTLMLSSSRQMAAYLKSIDSQIGGVAAVLVRSGDVGAGTVQASKPSGILGSLFGSRIDVNASGLYAAAQSLEQVLSGGLNTQAYSDITKVSKFLGIVTSKKTSTTFGAADPAVGEQFTLILRSFNDAIKAAAGPLGESTAAIQAKLNGFVVNIGKVDLQGLTGAEIQSKLTAVFSAAADQMANTAFPGMQQFQKVGEGAFETLVRVSSTVEAVTSALDQLASAGPQLSIAAKVGLADQFESISDFTSAVGAYFEGYYTQAEQAAAKTAQFGKVFDSLGLAMPTTLAGFRALVEAQNLATAAGQATYATLLQLAPAFADLQSSLEGAKSAADIASERTDLQRQLLELQGNTAELRALELAKLDPSNRALQEQINAIKDAQDAAKAADDLRKAWQTVGDTIMAEVNRIRGITGTAQGGGFAQLQGQFNAATTAARGGDQDAAKLLPGLSQSLLTAAQAAATSRQELARVQAQTAASLEATYGVVSALTMASTSATATTTADAAAAAGGATTGTADRTASLEAAVERLTDEVKQLRSENMATQSAIVGNTGKIARKLDDVTMESGGTAISTTLAA